MQHYGRGFVGADNIRPYGGLQLTKGLDKMRSGFTFFRSYYEAAQNLNDKQRLQLYDAIIQYAIDGIEANLGGVAESMFILIKPTLDKSRAKSQAGAIGGKANFKQIESDKDKDKDDDIDKDFETFWEAYPKKSAKKDAQKAWRRLKPNQKLLDEIMLALENAKKSKAWQEPKYIPHPATWLNGERYKDEPEVQNDDPHREKNKINPGEITEGERLIQFVYRQGYTDIGDTETKF